MSIIRQFKRLQYLDYVIKRKATGSLEAFAKKNSLSKSGLAAILSEMKEMGFPIKYSRKYNSYFYEENGEMVKCLFMKKGQMLSRDDLRGINAIDTKNLCFSKLTVFSLCD